MITEALRNLRRLWYHPYLPFFRTLCKHLLPHLRRYPTMPRIFMFWLGGYIVLLLVLCALL